VECEIAQSKQMIIQQATQEFLIKSIPRKARTEWLYRDKNVHKQARVWFDFG